MFSSLFRCSLPDCDGKAINPFNYSMDFNATEANCYSFLPFNSSLTNESMCDINSLIKSDKICDRFIYDETEFKATIVTKVDWFN